MNRIDHKRVNTKTMYKNASIIFMRRMMNTILEKRDATQVSPLGDEHCNKKTRNGSEKAHGMKELDEIEPRILMGNNPEMYIAEAQGGLEFIYCDQGLSEGFINPFTVKYFHVNPEDRTGMNNLAKYKKITKIIAIAPRRKSATENEPAMKPAGKSDNQTVKYKKSYLVRYCPEGSTSSEKHTALQAITDVSKGNECRGDKLFFVVMVLITCYLYFVADFK